MKRPLKLLIAISTGILLISCGKKEEVPMLANPPPKPTKEPVSGNPLTAPVDYLGALGAAKKSAEKTIDTVALNQAIQLFNVQEDRYPTDLNELVAKRYIGSLPAAPPGMKFSYDPTKGEVKIVRQ